VGVGWGFNPPTPPPPAIQTLSLGSARYLARLHRTAAKREACTKVAMHCRPSVKDKNTQCADSPLGAEQPAVHANQTSPGDADHHACNVCHVTSRCVTSCHVVCHLLKKSRQHNGPVPSTDVRILLFLLLRYSERIIYKSLFQHKHGSNIRKAN